MWLKTVRWLKYLFMEIDVKVYVVRLQFVDVVEMNVVQLQFVDVVEMNDCGPEL